jgi:hypothetical protein
MLPLPSGLDRSNVCAFRQGADSINEEVQRLAIEAGKFPEFDNIHPAFPTFAF